MRAYFVYYAPKSKDHKPRLIAMVPTKDRIFQYIMNFTNGTTLEWQAQEWSLALMPDLADAISRLHSGVKAGGVPAREWSIDVPAKIYDNPLSRSQSDSPAAPINKWLNGVCQQFDATDQTVGATIPSQPHDEYLDHLRRRANEMESDSLGSIVLRTEAVGQRDVPKVEPLRGQKQYVRPNGQTYYARQWGEHTDVEVVRKAREIGQSVFLMSPPGTGKALKSTEPVLRPDGTWTQIQDLMPGDEVVGSNGRPTTVTGVYPQGVREIVRVTFKDGSTALCDWDHLWTYSTADDRRTGRVRTETLREIVARGLKRGGKRAVAIPVMHPAEFPRRDFVLDPYTLGALLGDGNFTNGGRITTDAEVLDNISRAGYRTSERAHGSVGIVEGRVLQVTELLRDLGLEGHKAGGKFIPDEYFSGSVAQREALLQGLMDTDGSVDRKGCVEFSSASENLAEGVRRLVLSLGGVARIVNRAPWFTYSGERRTGQKSYRMVITLPPEIRPFSLTRKAEMYTPRTRPGAVARYIESVAVEGMFDATCIRVSADDHLFVTGDYIVTHNTALFEAAFGTDLHTVIGSGGAEESDLLGQWVADPDGTFRWVDGPAVIAAERGEGLFLDEVGLFDSKVLSPLYPLMDGRGELYLTANPDRGVIKAKKGFFIVAATNPKAPGVRMSEAILSRFAIQAVMNTDYVLLEKVIGVNAQMCRIASNLNRKMKEEEISWAPQFRELLAFHELEKTFGTAFAVANLLTGVPEQDMDEVQQAIVGGMGAKYEGAEIV